MIMEKEKTGGKDTSIFIEFWKQQVSNLKGKVTEELLKHWQDLKTVLSVCDDSVDDC